MLLQDQVELFLDYFDRKIEKNCLLAGVVKSEICSDDWVGLEMQRYNGADKSVRKTINIYYRTISFVKSCTEERNITDDFARTS